MAYRKYGNKKTTYQGYTFDSLAECARYRELELLAAAGVIKRLEVHPKFTLLPSFKDGSGKRHRAVTYSADFAYWEDGRRIAEDVKGAVTEAFKIKAKLFAYKFRTTELRIVRA